MFRKYFFEFLASMAILLTGCYNSTKLDRHQADKAFDYDHASIFIIEDDSTIGHYQISKGACSIIKDTLIGNAAKISEEGLLSAVHLKVPISKIKYIEVQDLNVGNTILLTGVLVGGTAALIAAIASSGESKPQPSPLGGQKFSCPLIYTLGESGYKLESETFAGAVFKGIERTSYDVLRYLKPVKGSYILKLVNAREETEYVNELKLITVDHSPEVIVIPDIEGNIHTISELIKPLKVFDRNNNDVTKIINEEDGNNYESNLKAVNLSNDNELVDHITAVFAKPSDAKVVKLIVSGLNTELAYLALEKVFTFQGDKKIDWYNRLDSDPTEKSKFVGWLIREGMLHFSVWNGKTWSERGVIPDAGPGVEKTQITILNIADIQDDTLKIRASFRTGLWRIDRIAVDYSFDSPVKINELSVASAINEKGEDVSNLIAESDSAYYVTINGEQAEISFPVLTESLGLSRSVIAKTKGFYNQWTLHGDKPEPELVDRILNEPLFGSKLLIPLWLKELLKN